MVRVRLEFRGKPEIFVDDGVLSDDLARSAALPAAPAVRIAFAAAHVVMRAEYASVGHSGDRPGAPEELASFVDLDATLAIRERLAAEGFGIAEAMDTAQRFEIGWPLAARLIEACGRLRLPQGFVAGASSDHAAAPVDVAALAAAVAEQCRFIARHGGVPVILPMPVLCAWRAAAADYVEVHRRILAATDGPLVLHWLGPMFLPALQGYFPDDSFDAVLDLAPDRIVGCKLSLLDEALELRVRRRILPRGQIVLTGDDFHFGSLMLGGAVERIGDFAGRRLALGDFSHALLGILDGCARPAGLALRLLAQGETDRAARILSRCEELGRHVFAEPTRHYKAGLALIAWLDGWQDRFLLPNHAERARDLAHHLRTVELASAAGVFRDAAATARRVEELVRTWI